MDQMSHWMPSILSDSKLVQTLRTVDHDQNRVRELAENSIAFKSFSKSPTGVKNKGEVHFLFQERNAEADLCSEIYEKVFKRIDTTNLRDKMEEDISLQPIEKRTGSVSIKRN